MSKQTTIKEWYSSLPANKQATYRNSIMKTCEWGKVKFYKVLRGETKVAKLEREFINKIAGVELSYPNTQLQQSIIKSYS